MLIVTPTAIINATTTSEIVHLIEFDLNICRPCTFQPEQLRTKQHKTARFAMN